MNSDIDDQEDDHTREGVNGELDDDKAEVRNRLSKNDLQNAVEGGQDELLSGKVVHKLSAHPK